MGELEILRKAKFRGYNQYLRKSPHWKQLKQERVKLVGTKCEGCYEHRYSHGHHLIYRDPLELCTVDDIMLLCEPCHRIAHMVFTHKTMPRTAEELRKTLMNPPQNPRVLNRQNHKLQRKADLLDRRMSGVYNKVAQLFKQFKKLKAAKHVEGLDALIADLSKYREKLNSS